MSTARLQVYHCQVCGNVVTVLRAATGQLVCCSQVMELLAARREEADGALHRVYLREAAGGCRVSVGRPRHPTAMEHHVEWIEVQTGRDHAERRWLGLDHAAEALFCIPVEEIAGVRLFCSVHGLFEQEVGD